MHKITPFLPYIKDFFKNPDMTAAMQSISSVLTQFKMIEQHILDVTSKRNCVYSFRIIRVIRVQKILPFCAFCVPPQYLMSH